MKKFYLLIPVLLTILLVGCGTKKEEINPDDAIRSRLIEDKVYQLGSEAVGSGYSYVYIFLEDGKYYYFNTEYGYTTAINDACEFAYGEWKVEDEKLIISNTKVLCYENAQWKREGEVLYPSGTITTQNRNDMDYKVALKSEYIQINDDSWYKIGARVDTFDKVETLIKNKTKMPKVEDLSSE